MIDQVPVSIDVKKMHSYNLKRNLKYFLFAVPAIVYVLILSIYPAINIIYDSFRNSSGFTLHNYTVLPSIGLYSALANTAIVSIGALLIQLFFALLIAMIMIKKFKGNRIFSTIVIIPFGISTVVAGFIFSNIFTGRGGFASSFLNIFGFHVDWIRTSFDKLFVVMFSDFWKNTPLIALILLGGLSSINPNLYEAAAVDGAGAFRRFFHITLPNIAPLMAIALLIRGVSEFNIFALPQVLIGDNPPLMNTLIYYNYNIVANRTISYSLSVILLVIILAYAAVVLKLGGGPKYAK